MYICIYIYTCIHIYGNNIDVHIYSVNIISSPLYDCLYQTQKHIVGHIYIYTYVT